MKGRRETDIKLTSTQLSVTDKPSKLRINNSFSKLISWPVRCRHKSKKSSPSADVSANSKTPTDNSKHSRARLATSTNKLTVSTRYSTKRNKHCRNSTMRSLNCDSLRVKMATCKKRFDDFKKHFKLVWMKLKVSEENYQNTSRRSEISESSRTKLPS